MSHIDSGIRFPGESEEYRRSRDDLLEAEAGLRRAIVRPGRKRRLSRAERRAAACHQRAIASATDSAHS